MTDTVAAPQATNELQPMAAGKSRAEIALAIKALIEGSVPVALGRTTLPLGLLVKSKVRNVRRKKPTPESVRSMAAQIKGKGKLLQNLIVFAQFKKGRFTGFYEVAGGERRLCGLWLLRDDDGNLVDDLTPIPVLVITEEEAIESSLLENVGRENMHPMDEFDAFLAVVKEGHGVDEVAARFGVDVKHVKQRLKLANVSAKLVALYREDQMTLAQLMAFTLTDDQAQQVALWDQLSPHARGADNIRRNLTEGKVAVNHNRVALFVGVEAYEQAGGHVVRDLFDDRFGGYIENGTLLKDLALAKLAATVEQVTAEGWAWVVPDVTTSQYEIHRQFTLAPVTNRAHTTEEKERLAALRAEASDLEAKIEEGDDNDEDTTALNERLRVVEEECEALNDARKTWSAKTRKSGGCVVGISENGNAVVYRGLFRPEDVQKAKKAQVADLVSGGKGAAAGDAGEGAESTGKLSDALNRRLTAQHTAALQLALANDTKLSLVFLAERMVRQVFPGERDYYGVGAKGVRVSLNVATDELLRADPELATAPAMKQLQEKLQTWRDRIPTEADQLLGWLRDLDQAELLELIGLCSAVTIDLIAGENAHPKTAIFAKATGLDMADWWEPKGTTYLASVPKDMIIVAVGEGVGAEACAGLDKLKKGELVTKAESLLQDRRWLPAVLRAA